mmetsp:Transcript_19216/g.20653  ORF Transcript_19216/g.20653 Transcript_19216/m.20653 type:complete len:92 (-) Transcript_19216:1219-1494(-)
MRRDTRSTYCMYYGTVTTLYKINKVVPNELHDGTEANRRYVHLQICEQQRHVNTRSNNVLTCSIANGGRQSINSIHNINNNNNRTLLKREI